ncbi:MAG TPA: HD domain-containing protein [Rhodothermales bacterium]|nr:HD domain-containing protein [Rhodothermales bacterium]
MPKHRHEFRDPIHTFITVSTDERAVVDSRFFQRLRHIHQLALTYLVYPGATHRRFEHCLGVMDLAGRVFDVLTADDNRRAHALGIVPSGEMSYWRTVVRMGGLCHDLGHIPFSHGAENLLAEGYHHERLSYDIITGVEMSSIFESMTPPLRPLDVAKVAVGLKDWPGDATDFTPWQALMSEIVTGDAFGVDRIDYLLRDSHHAGVAYGRFDHHRLIDTLRILWDDDQEKPIIGIEQGGLHSAEALQLARYSMFEQLYYHRVRRALDLHLRQFMAAYLPRGVYSVDLEDHLRQTDNEVLAAMRMAVDEPQSEAHDVADRIMNRRFYRVLYQRRAEDLERNPNAVELVYRAAADEFGKHAVERDAQPPKTRPLEFAVERDDDVVVSSQQLSQVLQQLPSAHFDYVFIIPEKLEDARKWLGAQLRGILDQPLEET